MCIMVNAVPRRRRLTAVRRRRQDEARGEAAGEAVPKEDFMRTAAAAFVRLWHGTSGLKQIAQLLWLPTYDRLFELECRGELLCESGLNWKKRRP